MFSLWCWGLGQWMGPLEGLRGGLWSSFTLFFSFSIPLPFLPFVHVFFSFCSWLIITIFLKDKTIPELYYKHKDYIFPSIT